MSGGRTEAEKDKRIKIKGVKKAKEKYSAKGRKYNASVLLNKMERIPQNCMTMKFYARDVKNPRLFIGYY